MLVPCLIVAGVVLGLLLLRRWIVRPMASTRSGPLISPPPVQSVCPVCGHDAFDYISSGLWDGFDKRTGAPICGSSFCGTCAKCGSRCAEWEVGNTYVPTDEEWYREIDMCRHQPFTTDELIERLLSSSPTARRIAADGILGSFAFDPAASRPELTSPLSRLLVADDVERDVRCAAARLLGRIGGQAAIPALLDALDDADVSSAALAALDHLKANITDPAVAARLWTFLVSPPDTVAANMARDLLDDLEADACTR